MPGWVLRSVKGREATLQKDRSATTLALRCRVLRQSAPAELRAGCAAARPSGYPEPV